MPLPKSYTEVLRANTSTLVDAAIHASAALVLHLTGEQRLNRGDRDAHISVLRELLRAHQLELDTKP